MPRKKAPKGHPLSSASQESAFMRLPREIRNMIYKLCLVVHGEIVPYKENYDRDTAQDYTEDKPMIALLAVDKVIRQEAASIFYGKNVWRITSKADDLAKASYTLISIALSGGHEPKTIWIVHARRFRRVIIYAHRLDVNDLDFDVLSSIARSTAAMDLHQRMARAHKRNFNRMLGSWSTKFSLILDMPKLISVTFNVDKLYCLNGCCRVRILREFFLHFSDCWEDYLRNGPRNEMIKNLRAAYVVGLKSGREVAQTGQTGCRKPEVPFVARCPNSGGWAYEEPETEPAIYTGEETEGFDNSELEWD